MEHEISRRTVLRSAVAGAGAAATGGWLWTQPSAANANEAAVSGLGLAPLDVVVFGDSESETAHDLTSHLSDIVDGALSQGARVLNPEETPGIWGGTMTFTVACSPRGTTYVTVKLWGGDHSASEDEETRLQLFCDGAQVGHYHHGAVDPLDIMHLEGRSPGRFYFHTLPLPEPMTRGKHSVELGVRSMGRIWPYGQNTEQFYRDMVAPTRGVYRMYTHAEPYFTPPDDEEPGDAPPQDVRPSPGAEVLDAVAERVRGDHERWLAQPASGLDPWAYQGLAEGYLNEGTAAYQNPVAVDQALAGIDAQYTKWLDDPGVLTSSDQQWEGFGKVGLTLLLLWDALGTRLDQAVGGPPTTIPSPGFEAGLAGWSQGIWRGAGSTGVDEEVVRSGRRSARITADPGYDPPSTVGLNIAQNRILIGQGPHRYSVWCKTQDVTGPGAYLDIIFYRADGGIARGDQKFFATTGTHDWELITADLVTPDDATELRIDIRVEGGGTAWFDDLTVEMLDGAEPPDLPGDLPIRRDAYTRMLTESISYWRQHLPHYSNQVMICALGIYRCTRGLELLAPERALPEEKARDYIYQAVGLRPYLGPEDADGNPSKILGEHYYQATEKGLTKELGYVGNYGEVTDWLILLYESVSRAGGVEDPELRDHIVKMINARAVFRYPEVDDDGYRCMRMEATVGWRDDRYPGDIVYAQRTAWDGHPLMAGAVLDDPGIVGRTQQLVADNQLFAHIGLLTDHSWTRVGLNAARLVQRDWDAFRAKPDSDVRFPMDWDADDLVFSDEENGVLAVKNGQEILYASLYWRARQAVNNLARIHHITPATQRTATIRQESSVSPTDEWYEEPDWVCFPYAINDPEASHIPPGGFAPPGPELHQGFAGERLMVGPYPEDVPDPALGVDFPGVETLFVGRAEFYRCAYGRYLIGMNTSIDRTYRLTTRDRDGGWARGQARNVATGEQVRLGRVIELPPRTTVVLHRSWENV